MRKPCPHSDQPGGSPAMRMPIAIAITAAGLLANPVAADQFHHIATFDVNDNDTQVAEIVDAVPNGNWLVYTDSATGAIGIVDIRDSDNPQGAGHVDVGGEPTSVAMLTGRYALVGVNTSPADAEDAAPTRSGHLAVVNIARGSVARTIDLNGQPDSIAISPDRRYAAIVVENERNEDNNGGLIPQDPPGSLVVIRLGRQYRDWEVSTVDLTGLADIAPGDPEPEFVDINSLNQAVVTLQENNHIVVVDLTDGSVVNHFSAGMTTVDNIDATEEKIGPQESGLIIFNETRTKRREPDAVTWIDDRHFATANEGDYEDATGEEGGSRGFTVFNVNGSVVYESAESFEHASARAGHYNEGRSANKGGEPESAEFGVFGADFPLLFVGAERANIVGVYTVDQPGTPVLQQLLPTGIGPEGIKAIPQRDLLAVASETEADGIPSMITLYRYGLGDQGVERVIPPVYPQIESADDPAVNVVPVSTPPIPWVALSGLTGHPTDPDLLYAVSDSFLAQGYIYAIDISTEPALIVERIAVGDADGMLDLEGIAIAPNGGFILASEGRADGSRPNEILKVAPDGTIRNRITLPPALVVNATNNGFEGVAVTGDDRLEYLYAVVQREWADDTVGLVKIARYEVAARSWTFVHYPMETLSDMQSGGWVGLSEITRMPNGNFAIIERDNLLGPSAEIKRLYEVDLGSADFRVLDDPSGLATVSKSLLLDAVGVLEANSIWTPDKLEGLAFNAAGDAYLVTDNDGLDDALGQTVFVGIGNLED